MKTQKHIEIVRSTTKGLSSMSDRSCQSIYNLLRHSYRTVGVSIVNNQSDLQTLIAKQPDLVFIGMKYILDSETSEKIWLSEFLENYGILHTGSNQHAIEYELNKQYAKNRVSEAGVPTAKSLLVKHGHTYDGDTIALQFPLFVKPVSLGGGAGINEASRVHTIDELRTQISFINLNFSADILIEEYLPGREFSVALLKNMHSGRLEAMPIELIAPNNNDSKQILSQAVKNSNQEIVLPVTDPELRSNITTTAIDAFDAIGGRDYGRIDIRMDEAGVANFLEANLIPSLISGYGSFPKACVLNLGMGYETMIQTIIDLAFQRADETSDETFAYTSTILGTIVAPI